MGSVAAAASVAAAVEEEATAVPVSSTDSAEGVAGGVGDSEELDVGAGAEALCALERETDRSELDARAVGEPLKLDQQARLVAVRRHRLAEHHQAAVVGPEVLARLLAGRGGLLPPAPAKPGARLCPPSGLRPASRLGLITTSQKAAIMPITARERRMVSSFRLMAPSPFPG